MLRIIAILFGIIFIFMGIAGYLPMFMEGDLLFGYLMVDSMHNLVHMVIGVLAILGAASYRGTRLFFKLLGLFFTIIGIWGFWSAGDLFVMQVNTADNIFHLVVGVFALYLGFRQEKLSA